METLKKIMVNPMSLAVMLAALFGVLAIGCSSTQNGGAEEPTDDGNDFEDPLNPGGSGYESPEAEETGGDTTEDTSSGGGDSKATYGAGSGRLKIKIMQSGSPANGKVRILTADVEPEVVQEGTASQTFDLRTGSYDLEVIMEATMDNPTQRLRDVPIKADQTTEREVNFTVGTIILRPMRGRGMIRSKVRWRYAGGGDWFDGTSQTGEELTLSTGRYDAEITVNRTAIVIEDVQVYEGKRTISPPVQMGGR